MKKLFLILGCIIVFPVGAVCDEREEADQAYLDALTFYCIEQIEIYQWWKYCGDGICAGVELPIEDGGCDFCSTDCPKVDWGPFEEPQVDWSTVLPPGDLDSSECKKFHPTK